MAAEFNPRLLPPPNWRPASFQDQPGRSPTVPDSSPHSFFFPFFRIEASLLNKESLGERIILAKLEIKRGASTRDITEWFVSMRSILAV